MKKRCASISRNCQGTAEAAGRSTTAGRGMTLYVLDTDIVGFAFQRHPTVLQRLQRLPEDDLVVTTIITFDEDLGGWLPACRRAPDGVARARAYARLQRGLDFYQQWVCLPFDEAAAAVFDQLRVQKLRIGSNDLA